MASKKKPTPRKKRAGAIPTGQFRVMGEKVEEKQSTKKKVTSKTAKKSARKTATKKVRKRIPTNKGRQMARKARIRIPTRITKKKMTKA